MKISFYKKVDRALLNWGTVIPKKFVRHFEGRIKIKPGRGNARNIEILLGGKKYSAKVRYVKRNNTGSYHYLRWDFDKDLLNKLREVFIQTYIITESQRRFNDLQKKNSRKFRSRLQGGQQEVLEIIPINKKVIKLKPFIVVKNEWSYLFKELARENVFGWFFDKNKKYLISKSIEWKNRGEFPRYRNVVNAIYYLIHTRRKLLYIGKARNLATRVKLGRKHQQMPKDWDKFRYDIVKPEYANFLSEIEDHTIRAFAYILKNRGNCHGLDISNYKLVNRSIRNP
ncbi:hypothetical protein DRN69_08085 [Candidatus Pacearchaeota archaeon]|nr:MAG: hypothetical protein DRN69_08085 [Candidatus Pacearchaeota archaeon]